MIHIYLDAMGGDNAPQCTVEGAKEALRADKDLKITLGGPQAEIEKLLQDCPDIRDRLAIDDCAEIITNHDAPVMAIRQKKNSAQVKGMLLVREKGADGFVYRRKHRGHAGGRHVPLRPHRGRGTARARAAAAQRQGLFLPHRLRGQRGLPAQYLPQFGVMGAAYLKAVRGVENPGWAW
jgi:glycerol-3-phosphate acyltransferase PlsX